MKKIILSFFALLIIAKTFSQTSPNLGISKDNYLQKSKTNRTIAWILMGSGVGMIVTGFSISWSQPWFSWNAVPTPELQTEIALRIEL